MNILEIYKQYQIMPQQAEHMLRVAGVGKMVCENINSPQPPLWKRGGEQDSRDIIIACLLHDMGNIIKFDFSQTKKIINQELDLDYWREVQQAFKAKYGSNEHTAHLQIAKELGASERVIELIGAISFLGAPNNASGNDFGKKICQYADDRVSPFGVVSLEERFLDLRSRYVNHQGETPEREAFETALRQIETQIFEHCKIKPEEITEMKVQEQVVKLRRFEI
jgi:hypothetical protein